MEILVVVLAGVFLALSGALLTAMLIILRLV
jgi:hypothetical protein